MPIKINQSPHDKIIYVKVNGTPHKTYMDDNNVQRFIPNRIIKKYTLENINLWESHRELEGKIYTPNAILEDLYNGEVSFEEYLQYETMNNSSVEHFDSNATQTLEKLFPKTIEYKNFVKEFSEEFNGEAFDYWNSNPERDAIYEKHLEKFINKYYSIDNPLWH